MKAPGTTSQWLINACSTEIKAHRLILMGILGPLLAYLLPALMFSVGFTFIATALASLEGHKLAGNSIWKTLPWIVSFILPIPALIIGGFRERRRLANADHAMRSKGMRLPEAQGEQLRTIVGSVWRSLIRQDGVREPSLVCQPNFRIAAHAYDDRDGQAIEITAALATRIINDDPLAKTILRHEIAHLVHRDLPAIRRQSFVANAAIFSIDAATFVCLMAAAVITACIDLGEFPLKPTFSNILAVHLAILCGTLIVVLPLLLGRYIVQRYSAFLIALIEMRADVSAGIGGDGLISFSKRLEEDSTVKASTLNDQILACISTALSHFPASERIAMLSNPQRLGTPKLRYFAATILFIWLLAFHQGAQIGNWDKQLLAVDVALLQGLTVVMILIMANNAVVLSLKRACILAVAIIAAQALPLTSIEGFAVIAPVLTAALVKPEGFGGLDASLRQETLAILVHFAHSAANAVGGLKAPLAMILVCLAYQAMSVLVRTKATRIRTWQLRVIGGVTALASFTVSHKFFQSALYEPVRLLAFRLANEDNPGGRWVTFIPESWRQNLSSVAFQFSDVLNGPPILEHVAWLRVALPSLAGLIATLMLFSPNFGRLISMPRWK